MSSNKNVARAGRQFNTLSLEKPKAISDSTGNNNSNKKIDFILQLPLELITDIMKYFDPHILIKMLSVSKEWENCLLGSPTLWSTWNINKSDYDWNDPSILTVLPRVGHHILELTLSYSLDLNYFTKTLFNLISNGNLNKLESLNLYSKFIRLYIINV